MRKQTMRRYATFALALALVLGATMIVGCGRRVGVSTDTEDYTFDSITSVDLELSAGEVVYRTGDQFAVTVERVNYPEVEVVEDSGTLRISEAPGVATSYGISACKVNITVPADAELDVLELDVDAGSVTASDVSAARLDVSVDAGSATIEGVTADEAILEVDAGSIEVAGFAGLEDANVTLEVELGEVVFLGSDQGSSYSQTGSAPTLTATVEAGEITVHA